MCSIMTRDNGLLFVLVLDSGAKLEAQLRGRPKLVPHHSNTPLLHRRSLPLLQHSIVCSNSFLQMAQSVLNSNAINSYMATAADILGLKRKSNIPARWAKHYEQLCAERDKLLARDCSAPEFPAVKLDDLTDAACEESQRSLSLVAATATQATIFEVLAALNRIERGTY